MSNPSHGTKVTSDPASKHAQGREAAGLATSDSLAAESESYSGPISDQPSRSTTSNTTDTSGARRLDPAVDAEARDSRDEWNEASQLNAGRGLGKKAGRGPTYNITSSSSGSSLGGGAPGSHQSSNARTYEATSGTHVDTASSNNYSGGAEKNVDVDAAPTYVGANRLNEPDMKPKGNNIQEGGFDSDAPNASYNTDIGGKNDPGRLGLQKEQLRANAQAGEGERSEFAKDKGQFGNLRDEKA